MRCTDLDFARIGVKKLHRRADFAYSCRLYFASDVAFLLKSGDSRVLIPVFIKK